MESIRPNLHYATKILKERSYVRSAMQSEAKFERIRHQRDDAASRFEIYIGPLALDSMLGFRRNTQPIHSVSKYSNAA